LTDALCSKGEKQEKEKLMMMMMMMKLFTMQFLSPFRVIISNVPTETMHSFRDFTPDDTHPFHLILFSLLPKRA
jgi:hypothetical protein